MVFSSHLFIFYFLPLVLLLYYAVPLPRFRTGLLASVSYLFYGWANPPWALIMFFSTVVDYLCGLALIKYSGIQKLPNGDWPIIPEGQPRTGKMKAVLICSIVSNLALLG